MTRLPFPVHVVERVETYDHISRNRFVTRYAYHHGYFDGDEREFRGFGMVEQWDTEQFAALDVPARIPLRATWIRPHTCRRCGRKPGSTPAPSSPKRRSPRRYDGEYYRESDTPGSGLTDTQAAAMLLPDTVLPETILHADGTRTPFDPSTPEAREPPAL